ncbi:hypothetical protein METH_07805 [Leisingera methylohalidivorans DSM 14336]|uniref:Uncharacterized protein n=2 Tax=Leisingera methylohalidivorans TaxID=133924 RepID=V9VYZ7_9RHOB|nr:hypothetical protein METH_07805 [Leisingera methylohalidivorans DSM 14336]
MAERMNRRDGYWSRGWETRAGSVGVKYLKLRKAPCFPLLLKPRGAAEKAMTVVIQKVPA